MSSITKLSIRGIRSFSPEREETIEFYSPLTMVVGANGCGKTTIVECLKFACSGSMPPSARSGHVLINDPTLTDATEVKASIKLKFQNKAEKPTVILRYMMLTKKRSKMEFKQLDGAIRTINDAGENVSLSQKCTDLDKHVPELLGVSAAILESVVFCHQEDSSWPLQEGATLKKKFDDIFDSTRYSKALEAIVKAKKVQQTKSKELKGEVMELGAYLQSAQDIRRTQESCREKTELCRKDLDDVVDKIDSANEKIKRHADILRKLEVAQGGARDLRWRVEASQVRLGEKISSLDKVMDEQSTEDLLRTYNDFEMQMKNRSIEVSQLQKAADTLQREISSLRTLSTEFTSNRGESKAIQTQYEQQQKAQLDLMKEIAPLYNILMVPVPSTDEFYQQLQYKVTETRANNAKVLADAQSAVSVLDEDYLESKSKGHRNSIELESKEKEIACITAEKSQRRNIISRRSSSQADAEYAKNEYNSCKKSYDDHTKQHNASFYQDLLKGINDELHHVSESIFKNTTIIDDHAAEKAELIKLQAQESLNVNEHSACIQDVNEFAMKFYDTLNAVPGYDQYKHQYDPVTTSNALDPLVDLLEAKESQYSTVVDEKQLKLQDVRHQISELTTFSTQDTSKLSSLDADMKGILNKSRLVAELLEELNQIRGVLEPEEPPIVIPVSPINISGGLAYVNQLDFENWKNAAVNTEISARDLTSFYMSTELWANKLEKTRKRTNACPCCKRGMDEDVLKIYAASLKKLFAVPTHLASMEGKDRLGRVTEITEKLRELAAVFEPYMTHHNAFTTVEERLSSNATKLEELASAEEKLKISISAERQGSASVTNALVELNLLIKKWKSVNSKKQEMVQKRVRQSQHSAALSDMGGRTLSEIEEEVKELTQQKSKLHARKESTLADENRFSKTLFSLKTILADKESALKEADFAYAEFKEATAMLGKLEQSLKGLVESRENMATLICQSNGVIKKKEEESARAKKNLNDLQQQCESSVQKLLAHCTSVSNSKESLQSISDRMKKFDIVAIDKELASIGKQLEEKAAELRVLTPQIQGIKNEIGNQESTRKQVKGNLELRECQKETAALEESLGQMEVNMKQDDNQKIESQRDMQRAEQSKQKLLAEQGSLTGRLAELDDQFVELASKLTNATYKGIDQRFRQKNIKYETTVMAVADLECYFDALDNALANFHSLKVQEINKIIKELWQITYRGEDIDMIEIVSGIDDVGGGGGKTANRSYNYRIVMTKANLPMDMRGRCSAGQRVLAAIVIRLALAETFCLSCGILALDEPTTNLDEANKAGLAHSLARLIGTKGKHMHSQVVCITHDEDFVRMMNTELTAMSNFSLPEYYFRVSRQEDEVHVGKYFSKIERILWTDLL